MQKGDTKYCGVCHLKIHKNSHNFITTEPLECRDCLQTVHRYCYQPDANAANFRCEVCLSYNKDKPLKVKCYFCHGFDGIFKRIGYRKYCHVVCVLFSSNFVVDKYSNLSLVQISTKYALEGTKKSGKCAICLKKLTRMEKKGLNQCSIGKCGEKAHTACAFIQSEEFLGQNGWDWRKINTSSWYQNLFTTLMEQKYPEINEVIWSDNQELKSLILSHKSQNLELICPKHNKQIQLPCICGQIIETTWVQCDQCYQWSHTKCQKTSVEEVNQDKDSFFTCYQCTVWRKVVNNGEMPFCQKYPLLHFYDFVYIHHFYEKRMYKLSIKDHELLCTIPIPPSLSFYGHYCSEVIYPLVKNRISIPKNLSIREIEAKCEEEEGEESQVELRERDEQNSKDQSATEGQNTQSQIIAVFPKLFTLLKILLSSRFQFPNSSEMNIGDMIEQFKRRYMNDNEVAVRISMTHFDVQNEGRGMIENSDQSRKITFRENGEDEGNESIAITEKNISASDVEHREELKQSPSQSLSQGKTPIKNNLLNQNEILEIQITHELPLASLIMQRCSQTNCKVESKPSVSVMHFPVVKEIDEYEQPSIFIQPQKSDNQNCLSNREVVGNQEAKNEHIAIKLADQESGNISKPSDSFAIAANNSQFEDSTSNQQNECLNSEQFHRIASLHCLANNLHERGYFSQKYILDKLREEYESSDMVAQENCIFLKRMADLKKLQQQSRESKLGESQIENMLTLRCIKRWLDEEAKFGTTKKIKHEILISKYQTNKEKQDSQFVLFFQEICEFIVDFFPEHQERFKAEGLEFQVIETIREEDIAEQKKYKTIQRFINQLEKYDLEEYPKAFRVLKDLACKILRVNKDKKINDMRTFKTFFILFIKFKIEDQWVKIQMDKNIRVNNMLASIPLSEFSQPEKLYYRRDLLQKIYAFCQDQQLPYRLPQIEKHIKWYKIYQVCLKVIPIRFLTRNADIFSDTIQLNVEEEITGKHLQFFNINQISYPHCRKDNMRNQKDKIIFQQLKALCQNMEKGQFPDSGLKTIVFRMNRCAEEEIKSVQKFLAAFSQRIEDPRSQTAVFSKIFIFKEIERLSRSKFDFSQHITEVRQILSIDQEINLAMIQAVKTSSFDRYRQLSDQLLVIPFESNEEIVKQQMEGHSQTETQTRKRVAGNLKSKIY